MGKEGERFQRLPPNSAPTLLCEPTARLSQYTEAAWPWSKLLTTLPPPTPPPAPSETLSDGHLLNSLLLSEKKKKTFSDPTYPSSPLPPPNRLQEQERLVLSFCSPPSAGWRDELGTL